VHAVTTSRDVSSTRFDDVTGCRVVDVRSAGTAATADRVDLAARRPGLRAAPPTDGDHHPAHRDRDQQRHRDRRHDDEQHHPPAADEVERRRRRQLGRRRQSTAVADDARVPAEDGREESAALGWRQLADDEVPGRRQRLAAADGRPPQTAVARPHVARQTDESQPLSRRQRLQETATHFFTRKSLHYS